LGLLPGTCELRAARNLSNTGVNFIFHDIWCKNLKESNLGQVQDPISAFPGHGMPFLSLYLKFSALKQTDIGTISVEYIFLKIAFIIVTKYVWDYAYEANHLKN
jgi:hypothetical protein